jgi:hypothetical protein
MIRLGLIIFAFTLLIMSGCAGLKDLPKYQLKNDYYLFKQAGAKPIDVFVDVQEDTLILISANKMAVDVKPGKDQTLMKKSFDVDIMTVLFKYRPQTLGFPRQLNSTFNGNVYFGYRIDRFKVHFKNTPIGTKREINHSALTVGAFTGMGTAAINPWTTNYRTADEYDGLVLTRGIAVMIGVNSLTVGIGVGWDYLTDRDKDIWIYQNKPWYGLTLGLNLN